MASDPIVAAILRGARARGLDPQAVLAVARVEGLGGGIGDQGTSFGPFQLHLGGAMPRGIANPQQWARSQAGINYALDRIAGVARGKRGRAAVNAIVRRFERPARPDAEVARALGLYGGPLPAAGPLAQAPTSRVQQQPTLGQPGIDIGGVLNMTRSIVGLPESSFPLISQQVTRTPRPYTRQAAPQKVDMGAGFKHKRGKTINFLTAFAQPFGVQVTSTTHGNHVKGSYHYRGRAVDFGGDPRRMAALAKAALQHPQDFAEMFYTGPGHPGAFIKNGQIIPLSQLDRSVYAHHTNHVHIAR